MDKYQLSEVDFDKLADSDFKEINYKTYKKYNKALGVLAVAIAKLNDCQAILADKSYGSKTEVWYNFQGMVSDSVTCLEMMLYLRTELYHQQESIKGRRQKNAYEMGFAVGIADQVKEILKERASQRIEATGKSLVIVKSELVAKHFGTVKYGRASNGYRSDGSYSAGYNAGRSAGLSRQVGGASQKRIGGR